MSSKASVQCFLQQLQELFNFGKECLTLYHRQVKAIAEKLDCSTFFEKWKQYQNDPLLQTDIDPDLVDLCKLLIRNAKIIIELAK